MNYLVGGPEWLGVGPVLEAVAYDMVLKQEKIGDFSAIPFPGKLKTPVSFSVDMGLGSLRKRKTNLLGYANACGKKEGEEKIDFDYVVDVQEIFYEEREQYYLSYLVLVTDKLCHSVSSITPSYPISKAMYQYARQGKSLHKLLPQVDDSFRNGDIISYLTSGMITTQNLISVSIREAFAQLHLDSIKLEQIEQQIILMKRK